MKLPREFWLGAILSISYCGLLNPAWAQEKIRLAHSALESSNAVWYLAQDRGFYKKHGLDADLLFIPSTTTSVSSQYGFQPSSSRSSKRKEWPCR